MSASSHLNLFASDDTSVKTFDIDCSLAQTTVTGSKVHFAPALSVAASAGTIDDVGAKIHLIDAAIAAGNSGSAAASLLVQQNLNSVESSLNTAIGDLTATVNTNRALAQAAELFDAQQRIALETSLSSEITAEETARVSDVTTLTTALASEAASRLSGIATEASARSAAVTTLTTDLGTERGRIDAILAGSSVDLNTFIEVINAYEVADVSILSTIGSIQTQLTALQATVDSLTDGN